jgi:hypothetical protein
MASVEREPIYKGSEGFAPIGVQGQSPPEADDILILGNKFSELIMHLRHTYAGSNK